MSTGSRRGLEEQLQGELNESRICPRCSSSHDAKILVVGTATDGIWRRELGSVEEIEELGTKFQTHALAARKSGSLEYCKIEVINALRAEPGIYAGFIAESEIRGCQETSSVKPFLEVRGESSESLCAASGYDLRA